MSDTSNNYMLDILALSGQHTVICDYSLFVKQCSFAIGEQSSLSSSLLIGLNAASFIEVEGVELGAVCNSIRVNTNKSIVVQVTKMISLSTRYNANIVKAKNTIVFFLTRIKSACSNEAEPIKNKLHPDTTSSPSSTPSSTTMLNSMSALWSQVGHELRTPLNAVLGASELLKDTQLTPHQTELNNLLFVNGKILSHTINNALCLLSDHFSEQSSTDKEQSATNANAPFSVASLVDSVLLKTAELAPDKKHQLVCDIEPRCPLSVIADKALITKALVNAVLETAKLASTHYVVLKLVYEKPVVKNKPIHRLLFQIQLLGEELETVDSLKVPAIGVLESIAPQGAYNYFNDLNLGLTVCQHIIHGLQGEMIANSNTEGHYYHQITLPVELHEQDKKAIGSVYRYVVFSANNIVSNALKNTIEWFGQQCHLASSLDECRAFISKNTRFVLHGNTPSFIDFIDGELQGGLALIINNKDLRTETLRNIQQAAFVEGGVSPLLFEHANQVFHQRHLDFGLKHDDELDTCSPINNLVRDYQLASILVVDDNMNNQRVAKHLLEKFNCEVTLANSGYEAINAYANQSFRLVFMDLRMPGMDGIETTKNIRAMLSKERAIVVAMTAEDEEKAKQLSFNAQMDGYILKPINTESVIETLDKFLNPTFGNDSTLEGIARANTWVHRMLSP